MASHGPHTWQGNWKVLHTEQQHGDSRIKPELPIQAVAYSKTWALWSLAWFWPSPYSYAGAGLVAACCHLSSAGEHFLGCSYTFFWVLLSYSKTLCKSTWLSLVSAPLLFQVCSYFAQPVWCGTLGLWHHLLRLLMAESLPPSCNILQWGCCSFDLPAACLLPHGKHSPGFPTPHSLCRADVSYLERLITIVISLPQALKQWQRLLSLPSPATPPTPYSLQEQPIHTLPQAFSLQSTSETTAGILHSDCTAPGLKCEHTWYDTSPRVNWDVIRQLTAGTCTHCWTKMLG